jgi:hypothetical protein
VRYRPRNRWIEAIEWTGDWVEMDKWAQRQSPIPEGSHLSYGWNELLHLATLTLVSPTGRTSVPIGSFVIYIRPGSTVLVGDAAVCGAAGGFSFIPANLFHQEYESA